MSDLATPTPPSTRQLSTFRLDVEYTRIASALAVGGISTILLKGPAFDQLLFGGLRSRSYSDIDLLVEPDRVARAEAVLQQLGFDRGKQGSAARRLLRRAGNAIGVLADAHATPWVRDRDQFTLDLHRTLPLLGPSAGLAWPALCAHRTSITVVGTQVQALDRPAAALLIALHAAHHGPGWNRARSDLLRACEVLELEVWQAAAVLARDLRAEAAMGIGLGTSADGRALAERLGLPSKPTIAYRLMWSGVAWTERGATAPR
jgi:hypothetical protein